MDLGVDMSEEFIIHLRRHYCYSPTGRLTSDVAFGDHLLPPDDVVGSRAWILNAATMTTEPTPVPTLLYHCANPPLYPTNDAFQSLLAIRFARPVQVASVRIYPEAVATLSGLGCTYPAKWDAELLFNLSTADPVNALAHTTIRYEEGLHAVDYPVDMPQGVSTRLILLRSPAERISISIYGFDPKQAKVVEDPTLQPQSEVPKMTTDYTTYQRRRLDAIFGVEDGSVDLLERLDGQSKLVSLVEMAEQAAAGDVELEWALDLLHSDDPLIQRYLARRLPKLYVWSRMRGSSRRLDLPPEYSRTVATALLVESANITDGASNYDVAASLPQPYLSSLGPEDPLCRAFSSPKQPTSSHPDTSNGRRLALLETALTSPPSSIVHTATSAELLSLIAPSLLASLSTAPQPLFGIPSQSNPTPESQASTWAGKVYSSHQFRDRQRENLGLGITGPTSRPASRHVDDYAE